MQNIRSIFLALVGIAVFAALALVTFSVTLTVGAALTVLMAMRALSLKAKPAPIRATVRKNGHRQQGNMRVWNDGRGTIIDL
ncbi:hypothetical protein [Oryzifoliimicrobium ureilyticus]|uniref:hypothetical protein n=1 Tax=Oryzifoliimicrobium ureilyticus TaxID=3113724 RepID=UPI003075F8BC